ncbi:predicted protein [Nematostella vectensis]|uniref:Fibrinogen C-terminal domain-containing protein n=1 Tax=Nematostella vectensis TaxID=45351 RepID=A7S976_NEMVE|nr:predicted protein [Nematostella vectensis]|eukprot:XP_001631769.1 predicted protein [Nematostella vectensis]
MQVYCVTKSDGGAWTIIQRRQDGSVSFNRSWNEYKTGFGNPSGEFWLGLESIHRLTNQEARTLRVELEDWEGRQGYAEYSGFSVGDATAQYNLAVSGYTG